MKLLSVRPGGSRFSPLNLSLRGGATERLPPWGLFYRSHLATLITSHASSHQKSTSLETQQAVWRAEWEAWDLDLEAERDRRMAAAYLPADLI